MSGGKVLSLCGGVALSTASGFVLGNSADSLADLVWIMVGMVALVFGQALFTWGAR